VNADELEEVAESFDIDSVPVFVVLRVGELTILNWPFLTHRRDIHCSVVWRERMLLR
jgi:hypothetical protein